MAQIRFTTRVAAKREQQKHAMKSGPQNRESALSAKKARMPNHPNDPTFVYGVRAHSNLRRYGGPKAQGFAGRYSCTIAAEGDRAY